MKFQEAKNLSEEIFCDLAGAGLVARHNETKIRNRLAAILSRVKAQSPDVTNRKTFKQIEAEAKAKLNVDLSGTCWRP